MPTGCTWRDLWSSSRDWEKKANPKHLRDFVQYLDFFAEAHGDITLEREPTDDGVQLMTVHAAKGLEFPYVFVLSLSDGDFPSRGSRPVFEFPKELMKEEQPEGDFRIQEERRLFYVALTRARRQLTLTFVNAKRKKPSIFLEDILMNPKIKARDALQVTPNVVLPPIEEAAGPEPSRPAQAQLFGLAADDARMYSRIALWAKAYRPPRPEPLHSAIRRSARTNRVRRNICFSMVGGFAERSARRWRLEW